MGGISGERTARLWLQPVCDLFREFEVDVRITAHTVEVFHRGQRVAAHERRYGGRRHGTDSDHMPSSHRRYAEWTPDRFRRWARSIGPSTEALVTPSSRIDPLLLEHESTLRRQKRFEARARAARLRQSASIEDVDYRAARGLDRTLFRKLATCEWIRTRRNLIITGP